MDKKMDMCKVGEKDGYSSPIRKQGIYSTVRLTTSLRRRGCGQAPAGVWLRFPPVGRKKSTAPPTHCKAAFAA